MFFFLNSKFLLSLTLISFPCENSNNPHFLLDAQLSYMFQWKQLGLVTLNAEIAFPDLTLAPTSGFGSTARLSTAQSCDTKNF